MPSLPNPPDPSLHSRVLRNWLDFEPYVSRANLPLARLDCNTLSKQMHCIDFRVVSLLCRQLQRLRSRASFSSISKEQYRRPPSRFQIEFWRTASQR
jgi:hypothetical protein